MSENQNSGINNFSKYDEMSSEELEEILRLDAETTEGQESDVEELLYIMGVLADRKKKQGHTGNTAQEAYEIFKQHYMPETDREDPVPEQVHKPSKLALPWMRGLVAAAAVIAIVVFGSVTAKAFGVDIWKAVVQWTQETFHFGEWGNTNPKDTASYTSLQEALVDNEITDPIVPTWIPDGYRLEVVEVSHSPIKCTYRAKYVFNGKTFRITVQEHLDKYPVYVEQSEGLVEAYEFGGTTCYLFSNNKSNRAVWIYKSYECDISGEVTIEELKKMIDSIQKG
jgi:hypothetical protein